MQVNSEFGFLARFIQNNQSNLKKKANKKKTLKNNGHFNTKATKIKKK